MKNLVAVLLSLLVLGACSKAETSTFVDKEYVLRDAPDQAVITLGFEVKDHRFYGKSAVNRYFGTYTLDGNNLTFSPAGSTMMMGPQKLMEAESSYLKALSQIKSYQLSGKVLTLNLSDGKKLVFDQTSPLKADGEAENRYTKKAMENRKN